jgi:hypothetical protein
MLVSQCEGFRVSTAAGKLGVVESVVVKDWDEPTELVVCTGLFRLRRVVVPASAITMVDVRRRSLFADESAVADPAVGASDIDGPRYDLVW